MNARNIFRWALLLIGILAGCGAANLRSHAAPPPAPDWVTFIDKEHHFRFDFPKDWTVNDRGGSVNRYVYSLVTLNSLGKKDFLVDEQWITPNSLGLNDTIIANLLPPSSVYMDIGWEEGPPSMRGIGASKSMEGRDLAALMKEANDAGKEEVKDQFIERNIHFTKWGRDWFVRVYLRPPVTDETRKKMDRVLASFQLDAIPSGDEYWAVMQAYKKLPAESNPTMFNIRGSRGYQTVATRRVANDVIVTFTHDAPSQDGSRKPLTSWIYHVDAKGEVTTVAPENVEPLVDQIKDAATSRFTGSLKIRQQNGSLFYQIYILRGQVIGGYQSYGGTGDRMGKVSGGWYDGKRLVLLLQSTQENFGDKWFSHEHQFEKEGDLFVIKHTLYGFGQTMAAAEVYAPHVVDEEVKMTTKEVRGLVEASMKTLGP